jgi:hypothetical protein
MERRLHQRFALHRVRGEWFHLSNEISHYIDHLKNPRATEPEKPAVKAKKKKLPVSAEVTRLHKLREECGAETPRGRLITGILESMAHLPDYVRPEWAKDERQTLPYQIKTLVERLSAAM